MDDETAGKLRGMVRRVTFKNVKDDGETQTASVEVADGIWRDDVEIMQPYGLATHVDEDGGLALAFAVGGDEGDMAIMPVANPSQRMGKLQKASVGLYNKFGDKMVLTPGGALDIKTGATVNITTDSGVTITCQVVSITANVAIDGNLTTTGNITADGVITDSDGNNGA